MVHQPGCTVIQVCLRGARVNLPAALPASRLHAGQAGFVANMSDIAPRHAGVLFGLCNTFGSLAGILGVSGERRHGGTSVGRGATWDGTQLLHALRP